MDIYYSLLNHDETSARENVINLLDNDINNYNIDIENYDKEDIAKITMEIVSKNICHNITAMMLFSFVLGIPFALTYKSIELLLNPLRSKNKIVGAIYNIVAFIPNYVCSFVVILSSIILRLNYKNAIKMFLRDRNKQTIFGKAHVLSVITGALSISLGRNNIDYDDEEKDNSLGEYENNIIGDDLQDVKASDIKTITNILYLSSLILFVLGIFFRFILYSKLTW